VTDLDNLKRGDRVVIPKGTPIVYSTAPRKEDAPKVARVTHTITVANFDRGLEYDDYELRDHEVITKHVKQPAKIWWGGAGGYWRVVEVTDALREANR
jgi:hypothetical protein